MTTQNRKGKQSALVLSHVMCLVVVVTGAINRKGRCGGKGRKYFFFMAVHRFIGDIYIFL